MVVDALAVALDLLGVAGLGSTADPPGRGSCSWQTALPRQTRVLQRGETAQIWPTGQSSWRKQESETAPTERHGPLSALTQKEPSVSL